MLVIALSNFYFVKRQMNIFKTFLLLNVCLLYCFFSINAAQGQTLNGKSKSRPVNQKVVLLMLDGFGVDYYRASDMPQLNKMEKEGLYKPVKSLMPSVTNVNNTSICTGELPEKHGITGNSFFNPRTQQEEFMEDDSLVLSPTIFERAKKKDVRSMLFSSKKKTIGLLPGGTVETLSPETASKIWTDRIGPSPDIYSREVNYWLMDAALYSMQHDTSIGLFYIHTTDYPMHTWAPESRESKEHLHKIDEYIARIAKTLPGAMILITADHSVHHKSLCWDLQKALAKRGIGIAIALSPERDKYFKHHRGFGGASYVYLKKGNDPGKVAKTIMALKGVDEVLTRSEAAKRFHLMPERIGDLMVLGDSTTVFGDLDTEMEQLPDTYRSHGSMYETSVPLFIYNAKKIPAPAYFKFNYQIAKWLYPKAKMAF